LAAGKAPNRPDPVSAQLARFAQTQLDGQFTAYRNALYTACPYALGTYSYIELVGVRRVYSSRKPGPEEDEAGVTDVRELTLQPKKARYYWEPGRKWIDGAHPPTLNYLADYRNGAWTFEAEQHVCARGEPQVKPPASSIPLPASGPSPSAK
jgi:hypothetical protein